MRDLLEDWSANERYGAINEMVRRKIEFDHHRFWNADLDRRFGFWPESRNERLGPLAYHAAFAAYFNKPQIVNKLLALMRYVAMAPGAPTEQHSTWVAYVRP